MCPAVCGGAEQDCRFLMASLPEASPFPSDNLETLKSLQCNLARRVWSSAHQHDSVAISSKHSSTG